MRRFLAALTIAFVLTACSRKANTGGTEEEGAATPVQVATATQGSIERVISAQAVLYPVRQASIVPKISAPVARFLVQRGDRVREGQLVAVLEHRDLTAAAQESAELYDQAQASLTNTTQAVLPEDLAKAQSDDATAKEALDAAATLYRNRQELVREGALAQKLLDDAKVSLVQAQSAYETAHKHLQSLQSVSDAAQVKAAQAQTKAAKAHYEGAEAQASYAEVRSPLSGIVSERPMNVGELASAGSALLTVVDVSRVVARANVPVAEAAALKKGDAATVTGAAGELPGKVTVVSPAVDPNTTTVQVWVEAANPDNSWKLGSTVQITMDAGALPMAIVVPVTALLSNEEGGDKVMLAGADGLAHEQDVKVGVRSGNNVQILAGVKAGDKVITQGGLGLDDKAKITIGEPTHD